MSNIPKPRSLSMWRHFLDREKTSEELTSSMIAWQQKWNWDFLKINPAACYHVLDWGVEYEFFTDGRREPQLRRPVVMTADDVRKITKLDVTHGALGDQLQVIRNLRSHFGPELLMYETIFSPIEIAHRLMAGRNSLVELRDQSPADLHRLLATIAEVFQDFAAQCVGAGANGVFFATKWACADSMSWNQYEEFGKRYELPILQAVQNTGGSVILHVCGERTHLREMYDYPVDAISFDFFAEEAPLPQEVMDKSGKLVMGGIDPHRAMQDIESVFEDCRIYLNLPRWIAAPSCVLPDDIPDTALERLTTGIRKILSC